MKTKQIDWSEANIQTLKNMWKNGETTTAIALELTGSEDARNSVLGKAHRLKLGAHPTATARVKASAKRRSEVFLARKALAQANTPVKIDKIKPRPVVNDGVPADADMRFLRGRAWQPLPDTTPVALEALGKAGRDNKCHWPLFDKPFLFCAASTGDGNVYCETHTHLSIRRL